MTHTLRLTRQGEEVTEVLGYEAVGVLDGRAAVVLAPSLRAEPFLTPLSNLEIVVTPSDTGAERLAAATAEAYSHTPQRTHAQRTRERREAEAHLLDLLRYGTDEAALTALVHACYGDADTALTEGSTLDAQHHARLARMYQSALDDLRYGA